MPRVTDHHRASRRDQITDAAIACFVRKGFQRTSMADIIGESGLSAGAIYGHFASKQEIAIAVGRRVMGRRRAELDARTASGADLDPAALLGVIFGGLSEDVTDTRILVQMWGEATVDPELGGLVREIFAALHGSLAGYLAAWATGSRGLSPADAAAWAERILPAMLALGQGFVLQKALLPSFSPDAYLVAVRTLFPRPDPSSRGVSRGFIGASPGNPATRRSVASGEEGAHESRKGGVPAVGDVEVARGEELEVVGDSRRPELAGEDPGADREVELVPEAAVEVDVAHRPPGVEV
jgi:AcrR family transcriptional regulator